MLAILEVLLCKRNGEMNDRSFEDHERTLENIKSLFFNKLYLWTAAFVSPLVISYYDFPFLLTPTS
jgi:hypothetical protein